MRFEARFDIFALFMLLGLSQGIFLAYFLLMKKQRQKRSNLFHGLFMISIVIISSEILLNYTGLIVKVLWVENYSEPFVFLLMPLIYLIIKTRLNEKYTKADNVHFFPFVFYFIYCIFYFIQPVEFRYNSYVHCYHPDWNYLSVYTVIPDDPLGLRRSLAPLYISQFIVYLYLIFIKLKYYPAEKKFHFFRKKDKLIKPLFGIWYHALLVTILIIFIKIHFEGDLGDYIIGTYLSLIMYVSSYIVITKQIGRHSTKTDEAELKPKYEKSSLTDEKKEEILAKLLNLLEEKKYFTGNTISLAETAKKIGEQSHHVSQVINEKLGKNFYDLLSTYRIEEAKKLLLDKSNANITIEDIAEQVGYNSKAAFNKAFKNITGLTPSEFRKGS